MDNRRIIRIGDFKSNYTINHSIDNVLKSNRITEGNVTREFETKFAKIAGKKYGVAVNSGTSALTIALDTLHKSPLENKPQIFKYGRHILTTPTTYIADTNAIFNSNLFPVFVDIDIPSLLITPDKIKEKIEEDSKIGGIIPVHLFGQMCYMKQINRIAHDNNLFVLEDAAQAHGSLSYKDNKPAGSFGDISIFSFYVAHNIAAGELGIACSDNWEFIKHMRSLKSNGRLCTCNTCERMSGKCPYQSQNSQNSQNIDPRFTHNLIGYNFKTTDIISAIALAQIDDIKNIIKKRQENVKYLNDNIGDMTDMFHLPHYSTNVSYLAYPLVLKEEYTNDIDISNMRNELEKRGIETRPIFPSIPTRQPAYNWLKETYENRLPNANYVSDNGLYIGCHQGLIQEDLDYMINNIIYK